MKRQLYSVLLALPLLALWSCGGSEQQDQVAELPADSSEASESGKSESEAEAEVTREALEDAETVEEKTAILRDFVDRYPGSEEVSGVASMAVYMLAGEMDRPDAARVVVDEALASCTDGAVKMETQLQLARLLGMTGESDELSALARSMAEEHDFQFTDYLSVMKAGVEAEAWELVAEQARGSRALATPEAFKTQWPDMSDDEAESFGARRVAYASAYEAWALENLGETQQALTLFEEGVEKTTYTLLGADDTPLHLFWGKTLLRQDDPEGAMEKLAVEAIHGDGEEAAQIYREAWIAANGNDDGLDDHIWQVRQEKAVTLQDFTLANYNNEDVSLSDFEGDVVLLVAWNPG